MAEITSLFFLATPAILVYAWLRNLGLEYIIIHYRWVFVIFFLMPLSLVYDSVFFIRNWIIFKLHSAPHKHAEKIKYVQDQVGFNF